jgi:23S rRNA (adenine2503-C2)-methyltransferase
MEGADRVTPALYDLDRARLASLLEAWGEPSYRAEQVWEWLYVHLVDNPEGMTNLPRSLRDRLSQETTIHVLEVADTAQTSDRRTRKDLLRLPDGEMIEAVLMRYEQRRTACLSTQVGCAIGCPFCATGQMGLLRDLSSGEIVAQALHFERQLRAEGERLTNVVLMGMGEPLANYDASLAAIRRLNHPAGFRLGGRHITLSTVGLVPEMRRLAGERLQITLAVSLHAATDDLRDRLVPVNRRYGLDALFAACADYAERTGRRITFEWALIAGVNDTPQQPRALANRLHRSKTRSKSRSGSRSGSGSLSPRHVHVNLIPLNPSAGYSGSGSSSDAVDAFAAVLREHHVPCTVRVRRGAAIQAGCGQLRGRSSQPGTPPTPPSGAVARTSHTEKETIS